jgi:glycosyltransferase involved in cell wall biosynthesis
LYPRANVIICQSEEMGEDLAVHFGIARNKLKVLYNPIDPITPSGRFDVSIATELWPQNAWPRLLAVGRLSPEKGFDLLIHAVSRLRKHYPQIHARILGSGPQEAALKQLAADLGLLEALSFPGHIRNVAAYYDGTTLFALSSRHEGMPNALLEAAMAGLPIVSTPCSSGLSQLLSTASGTWISHEISARSLVATLATALAILTKAQHDRFNGPSEQPLRFDHAFIKPFRTPIAIAAYEELIAAQAALCRRNLS